MPRRIAVFVLMLTALFVSGILLLERDRPLETLVERYAPPPSRFVRIQGMNVHLRDEGSGTPLILLHGTGSSLHTWDEWTEALKDSVRVVRFDLPGFGLTGPHPSGDYSIASYVDFVLGVADALDLHTFDLGGNSLGGRIAWGLAATHPDRVRRLVLVDPSGAPTDAVGGDEEPLVFRMARWPGAHTLFSWIDPRPFVSKSLKETYFDDALLTEPVLERYSELSLRPGNRSAFVDRVRSSEPIPLSRLSSVQAPVLLIWGEEDMWTPFGGAAHFLDALPRAQLAAIENAGHVPMEERPRESVFEARRFLLTPSDAEEFSRRARPDRRP